MPAGSAEAGRARGLPCRGRCRRAVARGDRVAELVAPQVLAAVEMEGGWLGPSSFTG